MALRLRSSNSPWSIPIPNLRHTQLMDTRPKAIHQTKHMFRTSWPSYLDTGNRAQGTLMTLVYQKMAQSGAHERSLAHKA